MGYARNVTFPVWITRTDTSAATSAKAIRAAGFTPLIAPLLKLTVASTPASAPPDDHALAFTSPNGVRAFASLSNRRHWPVFTVGDATAQLCRDYGFETVHSASGDVEALEKLILKSHKSLPSFQGVTHLSGVHVAGDLVGALIAGELTASREIIYATDSVAELPPAIRVTLDEGKPIAVMLYSPKAAHTLIRCLPVADRASLHCVSLSTHVDAALGADDAGFGSRHIADAPNETALIARLETLDLDA